VLRYPLSLPLPAPPSGGVWIVSTKQAFADFYRMSSLIAEVGYSIPDYMGDGKELNPQNFEKVLREAKCRDFCSFHPNPVKASDPFWVGSSAVI